MGEARRATTQLTSRRTGVVALSTRVKRSRPSEARVAFLTSKKLQASRQAEIAQINALLDEAEDFDLLIQTVTPERYVVNPRRSETSPSLVEKSVNATSIWSVSSTPIDETKTEAGLEDAEETPQLDQREETPVRRPEPVRRTHLEILLSYCQQEGVQSWEQFLPEGALNNSKKLGEGVYGEVFRAELRGVPVALKIVPIQDESAPFHGLVNGERMKNPHEVLPELIISTELSRLADPDRPDANGYVTPSFVRLEQAVVVKGDYPAKLIEEWKRFRKAKGSENENPRRYSSPGQLFLVFALSLGGKDLESYTVRNENEAMSIFFQTALSLAVAEECLEFEHRDLHIGNLLIDKCSAQETIRYVLNGKEFILKSHGVRVSIIDFNNSRIRKAGTTIFLDLSDDEELFQGSGDYQFDIYRIMRDKNAGNWAEFTPLTKLVPSTCRAFEKATLKIICPFSLLWLHYLSSKLFACRKISAVRRTNALNQMDQLLKYERIRSVVDDEVVGGIFQKYVEERA